METYQGKAAIAEWFENRGIGVERDGDRLYALRPVFNTQDERGVWQTTYERHEVRTMEDAKAVWKKLDL